MGNNQAKRPIDESQTPGDGSSSNIIVGSPMEDSGFVFPDHNEMLRVSYTVTIFFAWLFPTIQHLVGVHFFYRVSFCILRIFSFKSHIIVLSLNLLIDSFIQLHI